GSCGGRRIRLPRFLAPVLGEEIGVAELSHAWRRVAREARAALDLLARAQFGQHVHLARLMALAAQGKETESAARENPRLRRLLETLAPDLEIRVRMARFRPVV